MTKIVLKSGKEISVFRFHPWIFSGAIKKIEGDPEEGDVVAVYSNKDELLGYGHYQKGSIAIRMLSFGEEPPNNDFFVKKITKAFLFRKKFNFIDNPITNCFRLINAEGDELPGLIVDYYNGLVVIQCHSIGFYKIRHIIVDTIIKLFKEKVHTIYDKSETTLPIKDIKNEFLYGEQREVEVLENNLKFHINVIDGQKTGFFIDQRDNRYLLTKYCSGKVVLNTFCYSGAFSVYALKNNAQLVHSIDISDKAIKWAKINFQLNEPYDGNHEEFIGDVFDFLDSPPCEYDLIILDPPAFAKHQDALHNALQGYKRINQKALKIIKPGGILMTFSCSQVVSKENFKKSVFIAAANAKRNVKIIHQTAHSVDHPVNIFHPEGEYLKGLILYVE